ncbi:MAG: DUF3658 domain-containing protein [Proteiniphilum sp.]
MNNKDIHVVFGNSAKGLFIQSKKFDLDAIQLICLEDALNLGPICDLDSVEEIKKRSNWWSKVFDDPEKMGEEKTFTLINKDVETIKRVVANYTNEKIYLWTGLVASEIISTARLLYHLQPLNNHIHLFDFSNFSMKNVRGEVIHPECLSVTDLCRVDDVKKHFRILTEEELLKFRQLWKKVKSENFLLWIVENGRIVEKDETYFDSFLLSYCSSEFQHPARVIGHTLYDADFNVGDSFLNYRLKQLILMEKVEYRGELKEMRHYKVRLPK